MRARLVSADGGPSIDLLKDMTLFGRDEDCDVRLDHKSVSKLHCVIVKTDGLLLLRDLGSTNGTRVNGQRVRLPVDREAALDRRDGLAARRRLSRGHRHTRRQDRAHEGPAAQREFQSIMDALVHSRLSRGDRASAVPPDEDGCGLPMTPLEQSGARSRAPFAASGGTAYPVETDDPITLTRAVPRQSLA